MIKAYPGDGLGYKGKGRNANERKDYQKAIELFSYAITLDQKMTRDTPIELILT